MSANEGIVPLDPTTDVGRVRVLIQDVDATDVNIPAGTGTYMWQSDQDIQNMLDVTGLGPGRVAIRILRMVAMTPALQYKKWSSADLSVDGPAIARAIRDLINDIEKGLDADGDVEVGDFFAIVNTGPAMAQPALYPESVPTYNGKDLDPTLPLI
jgi:hypothetical protein